MLNSGNPTVWYKYNSLFVYVYVNTDNVSYTTETKIGELPNNMLPLITQRIYRGDGMVSVFNDNDGIAVRDVSTWTVASFVYPRK